MSDSFRDLVAWQKAMELVNTVYRISECFPRTEAYGLQRQIRDAAVSIPSNIAEGKGRRTKRDYVQFLYCARGSLFETRTQLEVARNLNFIDADSFAIAENEATHASRVLYGLIASIERQIHRP